ncbi:MAG: uroporphyrinogen decarboxylase family protein, partial [Bacteroidota bacterium]
MTGTERIKAALAGVWTDRRPVMLHNFMMAAREEGITMKEFRENPEKAAKAFIHAAEKYRTDGVLIDVDTATLAGSVGVPVDYPENEPARTHGTLIKSLDEVTALPPVDVAKDEGIQHWLEITRIVKDYFGEEMYVRGNCDQAPFSLASMIRGSQDLMTDLLLDPEGVHRLLAYATEAGKQFIRLMASTGADMVSNGDSVSGPEMIQPEHYREFAHEYEKQLIDEAHRLGLPYTLHICGDTDVILEDMVKTGADALELDYLTDIHKIYRYCHDKTLFIGNMDPSGVINFGTPALVKEKTEELLDIYRDSPRLMINAGCAIPPDTPPENIQQMVECAWADVR